MMTRKYSHKAICMILSRLPGGGLATVRSGEPCATAEGESTQTL
jgi:hypothetical protein